MQQERTMERMLWMSDASTGREFVDHLAKTSPVCFLAPTQLKNCSLWLFSFCNNDTAALAG